MKLNRIAVTVISFVLLAVGAKAQPNTTLTWGFDTIQNPTVLPFDNISPGAFATNTISNPISDSLNRYYFGMGPFGLYGTPSGLWDIQNGLLELELNRMATSIADYTIEIMQFVDGGAIFPGTVSFLGLPGLPTVGRTIVEQQTGDMIGYWVRDTYLWTDVAPSGENVKVTIEPGDAGNKHLLVDSVQLTVAGTLDKVPEPGVGALVALGLVALWRQSRLRMVGR